MKAKMQIYLGKHLQINYYTCKACVAVVQRFDSICWVVVREETSAMLGFSEHSPHNSRHFCHQVWDILNPNDTADKKSYVAP